MFWRPKLGYYSNPSKNAIFYHEEIKATSYDWWVFVQKIDGKVVFNDFRYSSQTSSHQSGVRELMKKLRIKVDVHVDRQESLDEFGSLKDFLPDLYKKMFDLLAMAEHRERLKDHTRKWHRSNARDLLKEIKGIERAGGKISKTQIESIRKEQYKEEIDRAEGIRERRRENARLLRTSWNNETLNSEVSYERDVNSNDAA